jgi:hypothetical protein
VKTTSRLLFLSVLALLFAVPAIAQDASVPGALELYPTMQAVGVRLAYTGDDNGNATARLEWRLQGGGAWTLGVTMNRITGRRWAASVMWLDPDTAYEVRAVIEDPDGGAAATGSVRTRSDAVPAPSGRTWWVAPAGSDSGAGTAASPLRTLQAAADRVQPGEEIRLRPGVYYQTVHVTRAGRADAMIHLVADGPGVILDGSDPALLGRGDWRDDGGGVFSIPFTGSTRLVCADSLQRLYRQASLSALQTDGNGVAQGWTLESGRLWVKLEDRSSPAGHVMHVARYENALFLEAGFWRVSGFDVRYYGVSTGGAIYLRAASGCIISDNRVYVIGGKGILMRALAADNRIERNVVYEPRVSTWPWSATKSHEEEIAGISNRGGRGNVIRSNTVTGWFDGMDVSDGDTDENIGADADFYDNVVSNVGDDGIETDVISGINLRLWRNRFDRCYSGFSVAPNYQGPEYIVYNTITNTQRGGFKFSLSGTGETWICHNTVVGDVPGSEAVHPSGPYSNIHFRNNILGGTGVPVVNDDAGESQTGNDFDGDLISTDSAALFRWKNVNYASLSSLRSGTGFEVNGRAGDPLFVSAGTGDYSLRAGSPAIDGALRLPGINDSYRGAAPDMGAFEFGADGPDLVSPAAIKDLRTEP